ncbi:MAG TPA: AsmA family protein [Gammaproteobacteria bacterium]|nr:AsmA family protein [Gammaproteobacteria bacterium]
MTMPRPIKFLLLAIALALALLVLGLGALILLVDPNDYRDDIQALVKARTHRELRMEGDLRLSVFPRLSLEIGNATLENAPGFSSHPLLHLDQADIEVRLWPLLRGRLQVTRLTLRGLEVNLERNERGQANWQLGSENGAANGNPAGSGSDQAAALAGFTIAGIKVENATLRWLDHGTGQSYTLDGLMLETGPLALGAPVDILTRFSLAGSKPELSGRANISARLRLGTDFDTLDAERLRLEASLLGPDLPHQEVRIDAESRLRVDLAAESLRIEDLRLTMDEATTLRGHVQIKGFDRPALRFAARIDRLDIDRMFPAPETATGPVTPTPAEAAAGGALSLPVDTLRGLNLEGRLDIDTLKVSGLNVHTVEASISAHDGLIHVKPLRARLYEGRYQGDMTLDVRRKIPVFQLREKLEGIQTGPLLKDYLGNDLLVSRAYVEASLKGRGATHEALLRGMQGTISLDFRDGAIKGVNLARLIREVRATVKGEPPPADAQPKATDFTELRATLMIADGNARNDDLALDSPFLRVRGGGNLDLVRQYLDYRLRARIVASDTGQGGKDIEELKGLDIPVRIKGDIASPQIEVDRDFLARALTHKVKKKVRKKLKRKLEQQLRKHQDEIEPKLQQQLKDTLKQLF